MNSKFSIIFALVILLFALSLSILDHLDLQNPNKKAQNIFAVIVPHHDLVKDRREAIFAKVGENVNPKTVIVVSTNHFNTGNSDIITTNKTWNLQNAKVMPDKEKIQKIVESGVKNDELAFNREHGIKNLLSDINKYFSKANIIPIIIKPGTGKEKLDQLSNQLFEICSYDCLLISSVDFSHYQPGALAEIHDNLSLKALSNMDENLVWGTEVDSQETLYLTIKWAKSNSADCFHLEENTNSGKITNERDAETTSYVFGWFKKGQKNIDKSEKTFLVYHGIDEKNNIISERFFRGTDYKNYDGNLMEYLSANNIYFSDKNLSAIKYLENKINNNNLAVAGTICQDQIKIVLLPWKNADKAVLLCGGEKTNYIKTIRFDLQKPISNFDYGYDIIDFER